MSAAQSLDLLFLGSGNAFAAQGRAFSSFLLNGRYLFDCGPTVLQQLRKANLPSSDIDAVLISHFHADHFFGLPFLILDAWREQRAKDLWIAGPPGIEERTMGLLRLGYEMLTRRLEFKLHFIDVADGMEAEIAGLPFTAVSVEHVAELDCFAFRARLNGRSLVYSGDSKLCDSLLDLVPGADVVVLECACGDEPVHLSPDDVARIAARAPKAQTIVTHLDGHDHPGGWRGLHVAQDLARFSF
ncbi:MAG: MBL fold metallo-hydrolase [Dehalococcoidia bacterium]|nr:MBL fold metallo-hydrolase [Dehalococcoidia bacterium]